VEVEVLALRVSRWGRGCGEIRGEWLESDREG
jgi:hypothetical protein